MAWRRRTAGKAAAAAATGKDEKVTAILQPFSSLCAEQARLLQEKKRSEERLREGRARVIRERANLEARRKENAALEEGKRAKQHEVATLKVHSSTRNISARE